MTTSSNDTHEAEACLLELASMKVTCSDCRGVGDCWLTNSFGAVIGPSPCHGTGTVARFQMLREDKRSSRLHGECPSFGKGRCALPLDRGDCAGRGWLVVEHDRLERVLEAWDIYVMEPIPNSDRHFPIVMSFAVAWGLHVADPIKCNSESFKEWGGRWQAASVALCKAVHGG